MPNQDIGDNMIDVVQEIKQFNAGRDPERLKLKFSNMRENPFVFLRGTCHLFYARLPVSGLFSKEPPTWVCGDLHLENFGSYKGDNRLVYFDLNDFDEAALAPATWDLVRFLTSVLASAESMHATDSEALGLCQAFLAAYSDALLLGKARWVERETALGLVRKLLEALRGRQRPEFLDSRTERKGKKRQLRTADGKKALPVSADQRQRVTALIEEFGSTQPNPGFYEVLDVARRIAGTGSLGVDRYVILVRGKGSPDGNYLLDLKQSLPSSLVPYLKIRQPKWESEAHRVVAVQRRMQAVSMAFLHPVRLDKRAYVLRGLQPSEDRVTLDRDHESLGDLTDVIRVMGEIVAWAQLRSTGREGSATADELIEFGARKEWRENLIGAAQECVAELKKDWKVFAQAYDDGTFAQ
jgi:uncharacterized protein (DUF2252 family)